MIYGYAAGDMMLCKDIVIPEITPAIAAEMLQYGKASGMRMLLECEFIEGYYTALKFPQETASRTERQAQRMNYDYCVQTMAGLMKKYAPEILK